MLLAGLTVGLSASAVRLDSGVMFISAAALIFAADFVLIKYILRSVAPRVPRERRERAQWRGDLQDAPHPLDHRHQRSVSGLPTAAAILKVLCRNL